MTNYRVALLVTLFSPFPLPPAFPPPLLENGIQVRSRSSYTGGTRPPGKGTLA